MSWYKPGRDPTHPGDPPPKWVPLGRRTRLALLLTVVAGTVIALAISATRTTDAAVGNAGSEDQPWLSSPSVFGPRFEVPKPSRLVTFPDAHATMTDRSSSG